jgi:hypothetical protein
MNFPDPYFGLMPGDRFSALIVRKRAWWQFWRPKSWSEWGTAVVPAPYHPNCRCVMRTDADVIEDLLEKVKTK